MSAVDKRVLSLMVVLAAGVCVTHGQERIKMCGRDLIRLAVSTCGNSRVGRGASESQQHGGDPAGSIKPQLDQNHQNHQNQRRRYQDHDQVQELSSEPDWYLVSSRVRRAAIIADICCERGCTLKELIQFC
ncbi:hypothetical protein N1851_030281 [Merluccius polli]|uniref:Insulin-like 3 n=1 Tax=Merluccius polli TaxID=89951 RepID=A0AA47M5R0_MERPO|nr:hypothetical protein N1851_030281 [Merluccius polli]